jgi:hypothetical protein
MMARNWQYPRWRRLLMQSAMWVILGGTVGLAALLDRHQHLAMITALGSPVQCGDAQLRLPEHWLREYAGTGMVTATESTVYPPNRSLEVTVWPPAEPGLVNQLLHKQSQNTPQSAAFGSDEKQPGSLFSWERPIVDQSGESGFLGVVIATTTYRNGPQVTIRLEHAAPNDQAMDFQDDIDLVRRIAATVRVSATSMTPDQEQELN